MPFLLFVFFFHPFLSFAKLPSGIPAVPPQPVVDKAHILSSPIEQKLNMLLRQFHQQGKAQIALLTVPSLEGETIETLSIQVVEKWKLGSAQKDNGVLLIVAHKERRLRIEVGQGLEGQLTDAHTKRILDQHILPFFKRGKLEQGLEQGVLAILQHIEPQAGNLERNGKANERGGRGGLSFFGKGISKKATPSPRQSLASRIVSLIFLLLLLILFITHPRLFLLLLMGMMMGGGRRGGFGGGGFGSYGGGGGGFSGGGASGSW